MLSPQNITKSTTLMLALGAIAAPAAAAGPIHDGAPLGHAQVAQRVQATPPAAAGLRADGGGALRYVLQDKQLTPTRSPSAAPVSASLPTARPAAPSSGIDWADVGIGAGGGLAISLLGIGGVLALSERRRGRTGTSAVATG